MTFKPKTIDPHFCRSKLVEKESASRNFLMELCECQFVTKAVHTACAHSGGLSLKLAIVRLHIEVGHHYFLFSYSFKECMERLIDHVRCKLPIPDKAMTSH